MVYWENKIRKLTKYHEVVYMATMDASSRPFGGDHTSRSCMLASVAKVLHNTQKMDE